MVKKQDLVTVIRDVRDASLDYQLPRDRAGQLYQEGKLDRVNAMADRSDYCHKKPGEPKFTA